MKSDNQLRVLLLLRYLYEQSSKEYSVLVMDILHFGNPKASIQTAKVYILCS